eukprot:TRINITY_DN1691_c0_g1_i1.p1 TRINITY_DN1691_c0_g1~~TRINITY_DN1691_c0_g1_i1.p1  ORF type:complete len:198 (+),score=38.84 TRINITY_DN1691_c0_g1_i1:40-633(+)
MNSKSELNNSTDNTSELGLSDNSETELDTISDSDIFSIDEISLEQLDLNSLILKCKTNVRTLYQLRYFLYHETVNFEGINLQQMIDLTNLLVSFPKTIVSEYFLTFSSIFVYIVSYLISKEDFYECSHFYKLYGLIREWMFIYCNVGEPNRENLMLIRKLGTDLQILSKKNKPREEKLGYDVLDPETFRFLVKSMKG